MRKKLYYMISAGYTESKAAELYDVFMMFVILLSFVPLAFKESYLFFEIIDYFVSAVFVTDYLFHWITADYRLNNNHPASFVIYPLTPTALIDMIVILSSFSFLNSVFKLLKVFQFVRFLRIFQVVKLFRYSKSMTLIIDTFKEKKQELTAVATLAAGYVIIVALLMFNIEPDTFDTFFDAVYWSVISLTTVGYGDIYPTTLFGRILAMFSAFCGIAVIALPSSIIIGGYLEAFNKTQSGGSTCDDADSADNDSETDQNHQ